MQSWIRTGFGAGCSALLFLSAPVAAADVPPTPDFFAAALCQPPYDEALASDLYEAAEALAQPDRSMLGTALYPLPQPIERDGFTARSLVFAATAFGVVLDGDVAADVAARYHLAPETSGLLGLSSAGFARPLAEEAQPRKELGIVSLVARQASAMPGKTLLMCEYVSHADRQALEALEQGRR